MQHAFISYIYENQEAVSRLYHDLTSRGIRAWLDRNDINPGVRWQRAIRKAIQEGASFIACFSKEYNDREKTYMNEELTVATDVLRQRPHTLDKAWFIPVKLNECEIPDRDIGGGETFKDFQYVELYKNWDLSIQHLLKSISPETAEAEKHLRIGNEKAKQGDCEGAISDYNQALCLKPNFPIAYYHRGLAKRNIGQYSDAISDFDQALKLKPDFADVYAAREETIRIKTTETSLRSQNTHAQREQPASKTVPNPVASPRDPELANAYYQQALKKEKIDQNEIEQRTRENRFLNSNEIIQQQYEAALADYDEAIRLDPNKAHYYSQRASLNQKLKRFEAALADYNTFIRLKPNDAEHYYERGCTKQQLEQYEAALADYDKAIRLDPNKAHYYSQRASTHVQLKQYEAAFVNYDKAIQLNPEEADFYRQRMSLNTELKRFEDVIADYDELIRLNPDNASLSSLYRRRIRIYYKLKQYEAAAADYSELIRLNPNNASLYKYRAMMNEYAGQYETLIADYSEVMRRSPDDATLYQKRGLAYERLEQYEEAKEDYEKAQQLADPDAYVLIYGIEKSLGNINMRLEQKQKSKKN